MTETLPSKEIMQAADILKKGGLVAFPTETVYGLGADASNPEALRHLYEVKGRPSDHPVIVHLAHRDQLFEWASHIPKTALLLAEAFWPGPLTLVLPRAPHVSDYVTGGQNTVGLRVPNQPIALELLNVFGGGVAAPSANRFGKLSPTKAEHVLADLGDSVDLVLDGGACTVGVESTIVDLTRDVPVLLRPGMISQTQLEEVLGRSVLNPNTEDTETRAPGTLPSHYAPKTPLEMMEMDDLEPRIFEMLQQGYPVAILARQPKPWDLPGVHWFTVLNNAEAYAQLLYENLRRLDQLGCHRILVESVPSEGLWAAVHDRLHRAAAGGATIHG